MKKFKNEKYITQRFNESTGRWSFQVRIRVSDSCGGSVVHTASFGEKDYGSARAAYNAAVKDRNDFLSGLSNGIYIKNKFYTVDQMFEASLKLRNFAPETVRKHRGVYNKYIPETLKTRDIKNLTAAMIQASMVDAVHTGATQNVLDLLFTVWRSITRSAILQEVLFFDPCLKVTPPKSERIKSPRPVSTNEATVEAVCAALKKHSVHTEEQEFNTSIICYSLKLLWFTGMRPAECMALQKKHVDFENNQILIRQAVGSAGRKEVFITNTKTDRSRREIPLTPSSRELLEDLMEFQDSDFLFAAWDGSLFHTAYVSDRIRYACKAEGIEFRRYNMRHQFATDILGSHADVRTLQELMGHANSSMSIEYARSDKKKKLEALKVRK